LIRNLFTSDDPSKRPVIAMSSDAIALARVCSRSSTKTPTFFVSSPVTLSHTSPKPESAEDGDAFLIPALICAFNFEFPMPEM
jgi:hypothetical protein